MPKASSSGPLHLRALLLPRNFCRFCLRFCLLWLQRLPQSSAPGCLSALLLLALASQSFAQSTAPRATTLNDLINGNNSNTRAATASQQFRASLRIGLGYTDDAGNSGDYRLEDFNSRLGWQGTAPLAAGLNADGNIELGISSDQALEESVALTPREIWVGLSGPWGLIRAGRQYGAFYEAVSVATDVGVLEGCLGRIECERRSSVLKFRSAPGPVVLGLSAIAVADDEGGDAADQIEYSFAYKSGSIYLGLAGASFADEGQLSGGNLFGAVFSFSFSGGSIALAYQTSDAEVLANQELDNDITRLTISLNYGTTYLIANREEVDNAENSWYTLGARQPLGSAASLFYEYEQVSNDQSNDDDLFVRAGLRYDF